MPRRSKVDPTSLTHLSRMEFPIIIKRTCPFPFNVLLGCIFHFIKILIELSVSKQWGPRSGAASDLGLHCLSMSHKKDAML